MLRKVSAVLLATMLVTAAGCAGNEGARQGGDAAKNQFVVQEETITATQSQYAGQDEGTPPGQGQYESQPEETTTPSPEPSNVPEYQVSDEAQGETAGQPVEHIMVATSAIGEEDLQSIADDLASKNPDMGAIAIIFASEPAQLEDPEVEPTGSAVVYNDPAVAQEVAEAAPVQKPSPQEVEAFVEEDGVVVTSDGE